MGYSISTPCKSAKAQRTMVGFLMLEFKPWSTLIGQELGEPLSEHIRSMAVEHGKDHIGFFANAALGERDYIFSICRFIALRVGRLGRWEDFDDPAPYIIYDSDERFPVLDHTQWNVQKEWRWARVYPWGESLHTSIGDFLKVLPPSQAKFGQLLYQQMTLVRGELQRLAEAWEQR